MATKRKKKPIEKPPKPKPKTATVVLVFVAIFILIFTASMIHVFLVVGSEPSTLITCVFALCGGKCGILGWIRTAKSKYKDTPDSSPVEATPTAPPDEHP